MSGEAETMPDAVYFACSSLFGSGCQPFGALEIGARFHFAADKTKTPGTKTGPRSYRMIPFAGSPERRFCTGRGSACFLVDEGRTA